MIDVHDDHTFETPVSLDELTRLRAESIEHRYNLVAGVDREPADEDARAFQRAVY